MKGLVDAIHDAREAANGEAANGEVDNRVNLIIGLLNPVLENGEIKAQITW